MSVNSGWRFLLRAGRDGSLLILIGASVGLVAHAVRPGELRLFEPLPPRWATDTRYVPLEETLRLFKEGRVAFVDARTTAEFARGRIPGAWSLPAMAFDASYGAFASFISPDISLIVYCERSDCILARDAADRLSALGYREVRIFEGGWEEWRRARLPAEEGAK